MKKILFTLLMVFTLAQSFAQVNESVVIGGQQKGDPNATVEIISKNGTKGLMPPRLTQLQINALSASLAVVNNGLTVYNTDEKCLQSWKGDTWTECNPVLIAKFDIDCAASAIKGTYYKDVPVTNNEYLELAVVVKKAGSYTFVAETHNGVRYFLSSVISTITATPQIIRIPAFGTPTDTGTFDYALVDQSGITACTLPVTVTENNAVATIDCSGTQVAGDFLEGSQVTADDYIRLKVNVTKIGNYTFETVTKNGLTFYESGSFSRIGQQYVNMYPGSENKPTWNAPDGIIAFDILDKDGNSYGCSVNVTTTSAKGAFTFDCTAGVSIEGLLIANKLAGTDSRIKMTINVTKVGPWKIETNLVNGLKFIGESTFDKLGAQTIYLAANGTPTVVGSQSYTITDMINNTTLCSAVSVMVNPNEAVFSSCGPVSTSATWTSGLIATGTLTDQMTATQAGPYQLTATGGGISLTARGTLATTGTSSIVFAVDANQVPTSSGLVNFSIKDRSGTEICVVAVNIVAGKGTKTNPGLSCLDIYNSGVRADGEYWIKPTANASDAITSANTFKTLCDMTSGGYTLVWSYNENTGYNVFNANSPTINGDTYRFDATSTYSVKGTPNYDTEKVDYANFRLSQVGTRALANRNNMSLKIRIASNVTGASSMTDANGLDNFISYIPTSNFDVRYDNATSTAAVGTGKLWGVSIATSPRSMYNGLDIGGAATTYNSGGYGFVIDFPNLYYIPAAIRPIYPIGGSSNLFGWFGEGGQEIHGHFYDCKVKPANALSHWSCNGDNGTNGLKVSDPTTGGRVMQVFMK